MIRCATCGALFTPQRRRKGTRFCSRACKEVERRASGRARQASLRSYFKRRYGLTPEQVADMETRGCAVCGTTEWMGRHSRPHIDHDHQTGQVRGLLCHNCNLALGHLHDDPELVERALAYLRGSLIDLTP